MVVVIIRLHRERLSTGSQPTTPQEMALRRAPLARVCPPGECLPRRYFISTATPDDDDRRRPPAYYYPEPDQDPTGRRGAFSGVPSRPWDESSIVPLDVAGAAAPAGRREDAADEVRRTMRMRFEELIESDSRSSGPSSSSSSSWPPKYLPPQFPQWDREVHRRIVSPDASVQGLPPRCCAAGGDDEGDDDADVGSSDDDSCVCRSPRNYPEGAGGPIATIVTAFYELSRSKHPVSLYQTAMAKILDTADPMIIFCEPNTTWFDFFVEKRKHAPTIVVPLPAADLRLKRRFRQETFWEGQYEIDPEGSSFHRGVNTLLYIIWNEKLILLHSAAMLNPFNTTQFLWVDAGYFKMKSAAHLYRQSAVRINMTEMGVEDESALLCQMYEYNYVRDEVISGNRVLFGGNSIAGTYRGIPNLYSAYYDAFWTMSATGKFVGSDQKVMFRACHAYPRACHIHSPRRLRQWRTVLGELLPGVVAGGETIGEPLVLHDFVAPPEDDDVPVPPNGIIDNATSDSVWSSVERNS